MGSVIQKSAILLSFVTFFGAYSKAFAQVCPSSCTTITSGSLRFCKCSIYIGALGDRFQLVTDKSVTIVDVDGDGLRDVPFGVWLYGSEGTYVLRQISGGIPGTFVLHGISSHPTYGLVDLGDLNDDGVIDFAITGHRRNGSVYLLVSNGLFPSYRDTLIFDTTILFPAKPNSIISRNGVIYWTEYFGPIHHYDLSSNTLS
ncbi:MAG: hypothetical protein GXO39_05335 [Thermotogae bacterium]|nr:hypothetical protein [Thermotogota bacterium]